MQLESNLHNCLENIVERGALRNIALIDSVRKTCEEQTKVKFVSNVSSVGLEKMLAQLAIIEMKFREMR